MTVKEKSVVFSLTALLSVLLINLDTFYYCMHHLLSLRKRKVSLIKLRSEA